MLVIIDGTIEAPETKENAAEVVWDAIVALCEARGWGFNGGIREAVPGEMLSGNSGTITVFK